MHIERTPDNLLCMLAAEQEFPAFEVVDLDINTSQLCLQDCVGIQPANRKLSRAKGMKHQRKQKHSSELKSNQGQTLKL